jgi:hypothetical protein
VVEEDARLVLPVLAMLNIQMVLVVSNVLKLIPDYRINH